MLGSGTILQGGFRRPRFLIGINGKPLFAWMLAPLNGQKVHFLMRSSDYARYSMNAHITNYVRCKINIILFDSPEIGHVQGLMALRNAIGNDDPLIFVNTDCITECDITKISDAVERDCVAAAVVAYDVVSGDPYFYASSKNGTSDLNYVTTKSGPEHLPLAGLSYWRYGFEFVNYMTRMVKKKHRHKNLYQVPLVYNEATMDNKRVVMLPVRSCAYIQRKNHIEMFRRYLKSL